MKTKVWWVDTTDWFGARAKIDAAKRDKLAEWDWIRFDDSIYHSPEDATPRFLTLLLMPPAFSVGKVISCCGIPLRKAPEKCQAKFMESLADIPENVLLLITTPVDKVCSLYKALVKMKGEAVIEEAPELTPKNVVKWIQERAGLCKLTIDAYACQLLADQADLNPGKISSDLEKLKALSQDGHVSAKMVETAAFGFGNVNVFELSKAIADGKGEIAHEKLQRLLERGEDHEGIFAFLQDWLLRLCFAEGCGRSLAATEANCKDVKKWKREPVADKREPKTETIGVEDKRNAWGKEFVRFKGETVPTFANPKALSHACDDLKRGRLPAQWPYYAYRRLGELQLNLRQGKGCEASDPGKMLHLYISEIMECQSQR